jgi:phage/plasmid primase-like uncharacterized protein
MLALYADPVTGEAWGVHRTAITPDGQKVGRKYLGPKAGCVIKIWPDAGCDLVVGEGLETVLSAATRLTYQGTPLRPAWAAGDAGGLETLPVIERVERLIVLVDHDENGRGQRAAEKCARRWIAAGKEVVQLMPRECGDFNDLCGVLDHA